MDNRSLGNVWEWVWDPYWPTREPPQDGGRPVYRVVRGGSWQHGAAAARAAERGRALAGDRHEYVGLRVARTVLASQ